MTIDDVKATQQKWVKDRPYTYGILGDIKALDLNFLKTLGPSAPSRRRRSSDIDRIGQPGSPGTARRPLECKSPGRFAPGAFRIKALPQ